MADGIGGDNLASAYVTILPDMTKFVEELASKLEAAVNGEHPKVDVGAEFDQEGLLEQVAAAETAAQAEADAKPVEVPVKTDLAPVLAEIAKGIAEATSMGEAWSNKDFTAALGVNNSNALVGFAAAEAVGHKWAGETFWASANMTFLDVQDALGDLEKMAEKVSAAKAMGEAWSSEDFVASLGFDDTELLEKLAKDKELAQQWATSDFTASFSATAQDVVEAYMEAETLGKKWEDHDFGAFFSASDLGMLKELSAPVVDTGSLINPSDLAALTQFQTAKKEMDAEGEKGVKVEVDLNTKPAQAEMASFLIAMSHAKTTVAANILSNAKAMDFPLTHEQMMQIALTPTAAGARGIGTTLGIPTTASGGKGGNGPLITSQVLQDAFFGKGGPNGFMQSLLSPLSMLTTLFGAHFMSPGSMAGFGPEHLAMTGVGALGSMAGGLGGGALLGTAALSTAAVGMGTDMAGFGQAINDIKGVHTAMTALTTAQTQFGAGSIQAANAQAALNQAVQGFSPVAREAVTQDAIMINQFSSLFDKYTGQAEKIAAQTIGQFIKVGEAYLPTIGHFAAENMGIIQKGLQPFLRWMTSKDGGLGVFQTLEQVFTDHLPTAVHAFTQGFELFARTMQYLAPLTGKFIQDLDNFFTKYNNEDWGKWTKGIDTLLSLWSTWKGFFSELFKDTVALFKLTAGLGQGLAQELTGYLTQLHTTLTNGGSGQNSLIALFKVHKAEILELVSVLIQLGSSFAKVYLVAAPALTALTVVVLQLTNALLGLVRHIPGGDFTLGLVLILAKWGALGPMLFGASESAGLLVHAMSGLGKLTGVQGIVTSLRNMIVADDAAETANFGLMGSFGKLTVAMGASMATMFGVEDASVGLSVALGVLTEVGILAVAVGIYELVKHFGALRGLMLAAIPAIGILAAALLGLDGIPIVALVVAIGLAVVGLIAGIIYLATHWHQVWSDIKQWTADAVAFIKSHLVMGLIFAPLLVGLIELATHWHQVWSDIKNWTLDAVNFVKSHMKEVALAIAIVFPEFALTIAIVAELAIHWRQTWNLIVTITHTAVSLVIDATHLLIDYWKIGWDLMAAYVKVAFAVVVGIVKGVMDVVVGVIKVALDLLTGNWGAAWRALGTMVSQVWGDIKSTIGSIINTVKGLGEQIINVFKDAGHWLLDAGKNIVEGLINGIKAAAHLVTGVASSVAHSVINEFKTGFGIFSPSKVTTDIGSNVSQGLANGITQGGKQAVDAAAKITQEISDQFGNLKAPTKAAAAMKSMREFFSSLSQLFLQLNNAAKGAGKVNEMSISAIVLGLDFLTDHGINSISQAIEKLDKAMSKTWSQAAKSLNNITGTFGSISKMFNAIQTTVRTSGGVKNIMEIVVGLDTVLFWSATFLMTAIDRIEETFKALLPKTNKALNSITGTFGSLSKLFNAVGTTVRTTAHVANMKAITTALNTIYFWGTASIVPAIVNIESTFDALGKHADKALQSVTGFFGSISKLFNAINLTANTSAAMVGLLRIVSSLNALAIEGAPIDLLVFVIDQSFSKYANLADAATRAVQKFFTELKKMFAAVDGAAGGGDNTLSQVISSLTKLTSEAGPVGSALAGVQKALDGVSTALAALPKGVSSDTSAVISAIQSMASQVVTALNNMVSASKNIGSQLTQGLANGINNGASGVVTAASNVAKSAVSAVTTPLQITSPSKVFHGIGTNMMEGLANGITQGFQTHVAPALNSAAKGITTGFKPSLSVPSVAVGVGTVSALTMGVRGTAANTPGLEGFDGNGVGSTVIHSSPQYTVQVDGNADTKTVGLIQKALVDHDNNLLQKIRAR